MAIGIKNTFNEDLDTLFKARSSTKRADVGIYYNNGGVKTDISNRYEASASGADQINSNTGIKAIGGSDLKLLFQSINYVNSTPVSITVQPSSATAAAGSNISFSVTATGTAPISYQWKKWNGSSTNISGATSSTLIVYNISDASEGYYYVTVSNPYGASVDSSLVYLTTQTPPSILANPTNVSDYNGVNQQLTVIAGGDSQTANSYQWEKWNGSAFVNVSGATSATYSFTVSSSTVGTYRCKVSNIYNYIYSNNATVTMLTVTLPPEITSISNQGVSGGWVYFTLGATNVANFSCTYNGTTPFTWTWYFWNGSAYQLVANQSNGPSYNAGHLNDTGTFYWYVTASNSAGTDGVEIEVTVI